MGKSGNRAAHPAKPVVDCHQSLCRKTFERRRLAGSAFEDVSKIGGTDF
jgi:hypothetical protein